LNIDDDLLNEAQRLTGLASKAELVRAGLQALIERESARRLARLGGSEPQLQSMLRRRSAKARLPMVLVDTSIWIDHFRKGEPSLVRLLQQNQLHGKVHFAARESDGVGTSRSECRSRWAAEVSAATLPSAAASHP